MKTVNRDPILDGISKNVMRANRFETCDELGCPEIVYIDDVEWSLKHWDDLVKTRGVTVMQKPHFLFIPDANDRLLFFLKWNQQDK